MVNKIKNIQLHERVLDLVALSVDVAAAACLMINLHVVVVVNGAAVIVVAAAFFLAIPSLSLPLLLS